MSITEFIAQAHPLTLDFIENVMMDQLIDLDQSHQALAMAQELREETHAVV